MVLDQLTRRRRFLEALFPTAPGVVSFTSLRNGYADVAEIDHGHGLKTAPLAAAWVGAGSTGRSTGPRLHPEVRIAGRPQNPERFLEAGQYVQQASND